MVLTVVVGSSGSGKTTFLNDTTASHKCTYIRQYHNVRPYIKISSIPNFDETKLPYWDIYVREEKAADIQAGGTMAGEFTPGLSGGQRKLLLFELICQRAEGQEDLLLVLDEPFAGVTDDFVPFIVERLNELRKKHNILLVTNDHVETLMKMADNTLRVSAIDRTTVEVNGKNKVDREKAIAALSVGNDYVHETGTSALQFFIDVEVKSNKGLMGVVGFTVFAFGMLLATFWNSDDSSGALVLIAANIIAFFAINPWLLSFVDWRNYMSEEADALVHSSKSMNKFLMSSLTFSMIIILSFVDWGVVNAVIDGFSSFKFWFAIFFDSASVTFPFICLGIYTKLPLTTLQIVASLPFLLMIFFSTTFSPGSGVAGLKVLRYLFPRFYFWCMIPGILEDMEGCPASEGVNLFLLALTGLINLIAFLLYQLLKYSSKKSKEAKAASKREALKDDPEFIDLQLELYGEDVLERTSGRSAASSDNDGIIDV